MFSLQITLQAGNLARQPRICAFEFTDENGGGPGGPFTAPPTEEALKPAGKGQSELGAGGR